jgi:hypothetical protein
MLQPLQFTVQIGVGEQIGAKRAVDMAIAWRLIVPRLEKVAAADQVALTEEN